MMSKTRTPLLLGLTGLMLLGCDRAEPSMDAAPASTPASAAKADSARSDAKAEAPPAPASAAPEMARAAGARDSAPAPAAKTESAAAVDGRLAKEGDVAERRTIERKRQPPAPAAGQLTAGRWSDRDDWSRWQQLLSPGSTYHSMLDAWNAGRVERVAVSLRARTQVPADAAVILADAHGRPMWQARTDNQGRADLYMPPGSSGQLTVRSADGRTLATREVRAGEEHQLRISEDVPVASALDLMFVVDTTGSMGDELSYLQTELSDIVARVKRDSSQELRVRTSVNFYRDTGDDYVVRSHPFTTELDQTLGWLRSEHASGGGDYPEALDSALADAVHEHRWSDSAVARIMFVITDAPPHSGWDVGERLKSTAAAAAEQGIRIVPIASSGVDKPTEFMLRNLAVSTGGTYVFLTDHSGIGGSHIEPTVGPHAIEPLNDLLVDVIDEYTHSEDLHLVAASTLPPPAMNHHGHDHEQPCGYAHARNGHSGDWNFGWGSYLGLGLLLPALMGGMWWARSRRSLPPVADARVARARRMVDELTRRARDARQADARSWSTEMREVVDGIEQLARQRQAIDASLRVAGATVDESDPTGMRTSLRAEVARRCETIDAEIDAGVVSVEAAYLHVIGGVGERSATQASLDAAREALQTRIEIERELRSGQ